MHVAPELYFFRLRADARDFTQMHVIPEKLFFRLRANCLRTEQMHVVRFPAWRLLRAKEHRNRQNARNPLDPHPPAHHHHHPRANKSNLNCTQNI